MSRATRWAAVLFLSCGVLWTPEAPVAVAQGFGPTTEEETKLVALLGLGPGKNVGEIGAGDGQLAIHVAKTVGPQGRVFATELSDKKSALERRVTETRVANIDVIEAQERTTGLPRGCCDAVFMRDVYHHLTSPDEILVDIKAALRKDGRLLIVDFEPRAGLPEVEGVRDNRRGHGVPMEVVVAELKAAGFEIVSQDAKWRSDLYAVLAKR